MLKIVFSLVVVTFGLILNGETYSLYKQDEKK
jgi:hypothetical protein